MRLIATVATARADSGFMSSIVNHIIPTPVAGIVIFILLVAISEIFVKRQKARGFTMMATKWNILFSFAATVLTAAAVSISVSGVSLTQGFPVMFATASIVYLFFITILTDFSIHKIPTESAWTPAFIGMAGLLSVILFAGGIPYSLDRLFVIVVLGVLPLVAFISLMIGGGGAADFRVSMAAFLATFWWVSPVGIFPGLVAFLVLTIVARWKFAKPSTSGKGRMMTPAGPAYVSIFAVVALLSLMSS